MASCQICGVDTSNGDYCTSCDRDRQKIDTHTCDNHKSTVEFLLGLPSHLFFYGLKYLLMVRDNNGTTLNEFLIDNEFGKELYLQPVWLRLKDYRCGREGDRWDTNPLLA